MAGLAGYELLVEGFHVVPLPHFVGSENYAQSISISQFPSTALTVSFWVKVSPLPSNNRLLC